MTLIEIDKDLIASLKKKYAHLEKVTLINADILDLKLNDKYELVISNLPYNISSQVLVKLSTLKINPDVLVLMFQKEFADRLLERKLNSINSLVKCFYDIKFNFNVSKTVLGQFQKLSHLY